MRQKQCCVAVLIFLLLCGSTVFAVGATSEEHIKNTQITFRKRLTQLLQQTYPKEVVEKEGKQYRLTFYDDFDGSCLDTRKWSLCPEQERHDVGGRWAKDMVHLDGIGNLVITAAIKEGVPYSGAVRTKRNFEQAKGYFEIRAKLQQAPGFWSAFWLMCDGANQVGNGAKDGAEIDIFEAFDPKEGYINHAVHWDGYGEHHRGNSMAVKTPNCYDGNFHTFSLLWTEDAYIFYIDGQVSYRFDASNPKFSGISQEPSFLLISSEFGTWAGQYDAATLPDAFFVDYVKVYQEVK